MSKEVASEETRRYGRSAGLLTIALGAAGLLAYAFFAVSSHTLDSHDYGTIVVLWSVNFIVAATLFRPIEQLLSRSLAEHEEVGEGSGHVLRIAGLIQGAVTTLAVVVMLILRDPITNDLLDGSTTLYWVLVVGIAGFGAAYYARGFLAGRRQFGFYATLLVLEGGSRLMFPLAVAVGIANGVDVVALGVAVAPLACLTVLPFAIARYGRSQAPPPAPDEEGLEFTLARGGAFAAAVLLMMLSEQILVSSGALFVRGALDADAAGRIFNILMVARAPLLLFQAVAASLLPHLTRLRTRGDATGEDAFRMSINNTLLIIIGFAAAVTVGVLADRAPGDADRLRRRPHLRPSGPRDRRRRDGLLPLGRNAEPGRTRTGPGAPRGRLLGGLRDRLHHLQPDPADRPLPRGRDRLRALGRDPLGPALPPLPQPAPGRRRRGHARLSARDRGAPGLDRRDRLARGFVPYGDAHTT